MSEHKHNTARYWLRTEPDGRPVYFMTESNASHNRAESDTRACEISLGEYEAAVPVEARNAPYDPAGPREAQPAPAGGPHAMTVDEVINAYRQECAHSMINAHTTIVKVLMESPITHAERIFILEMVKTEICQSILTQQPLPTQPPKVN